MTFVLQSIKNARKLPNQEAGRRDQTRALAKVIVLRTCENEGLQNKMSTENLCKASTFKIGSGNMYKTH